MDVAAQVWSWLRAPWRWLLAKLRGDEERRQRWLEEIVNALAEGMTEAEKVGRYMPDSHHRSRARQAAATVGGRAALLGDGRLAEALAQWRLAVDAVADGQRLDEPSRTRLRERYEEALGAVMNRQGKR